MLRAFVYFMRWKDSCSCCLNSHRYAALHISYICETIIIHIWHLQAFNYISCHVCERENIAICQWLIVCDRGKLIIFSITRKTDSTYIWGIYVNIYLVFALRKCVRTLSPLICELLKAILFVVRELIEPYFQAYVWHCASVCVYFTIAITLSFAKTHRSADLMWLFSVKAFLVHVLFCTYILALRVFLACIGARA